MLFALYEITVMEVVAVCSLLMLRYLQPVHAQICIFTFYTLVCIHVSVLWAWPIAIYIMAYCLLL